MNQPMLIHPSSQSTSSSATRLPTSFFRRDDGSEMLVALQLEPFKAQTKRTAKLVKHLLHKWSFEPDSHYTLHSLKVSFRHNDSGEASNQYKSPIGEPAREWTMGVW